MSREERAALERALEHSLAQADASDLIEAADVLAELQRPCSPLHPGGPARGLEKRVTTPTSGHQIARVLPLVLLWPTDRAVVRAAPRPGSGKTQGTTLNARLPRHAPRSIH